MGKTILSTTWVKGHGTGFTVLECLIVVSILAILLVQGVPALRDYGLRQRMSAAMHALHSHLAMARNDAVRFNAEMVACPGNIESGCRSDSNWDSGWLVFNDLNGDRQYQVTEQLLAAEPGLEQIMIRSSSGRPYLRFVPNGSAPGSNSSLSFCDVRGPVAARKLVVSNLGRIRREPMPEINSSLCPAAAMGSE
ncbi:MAG: GspH/FimT family pseudopilin [Xanthomonadales bacterium]|nr:GspH/FimT family pseudopilin [Xanthomonadales bacterium]